MKKIFSHSKILPVMLIVGLIRFYQLFISPIFGSYCRFLPTCSEYAILSIKNHGPIKGIILSIKRICSCHPFGKEGYDPVPQNKRINNGWT